MSPFFSRTGTFISGAVDYANQPVVKERLKSVFGKLPFFFGAAAVYDLYGIAAGTRPISSEISSSQSRLKEGYKKPKWLQKVENVSILSSKLSLVLSGSISQYGCLIFSHLSNLVLSAEKQEHLFGPNRTFSENPWHPRHIVSLAAFILALPSMALTTGKGIEWVCRKIRRLQINKFKDDRRWLSDSLVRRMAFCTTFTSRVALHKINELAKAFIRYLG